MINPRVVDLFGFEEDELVGQKVELLIPNRYHNKHVGYREDYSKNPVKKKMGHGRDLLAKRKDNSEFPIEISLNHIQVEDSKYMIALVTDITERKNAELAVQEMNKELERKVEERTGELKASQRLYELISRNYPDGTINVFDKDYNYIFVEGKELFNMGVKSEKLRGTNYLSRIQNKDVADTIKSQLDKVFAGDSSSFEIQNQGQYFAMHAVALPNSAGHIEQILMVERNITKQKNAEAEMQKALEQEKELNELKSRFVTMASHEFKTPLGTILSSNSLIARYDQTDQQDKRMKHVNRIKSSVNHLNSILNDILSLSRLEEGHFNLNPVEFDITEFKHQVCDDISSVAKEGQHCEQNHVGDTAIVMHDKLVLRQVLYNLLSNASKYSPEHSIIQFNTTIKDGNLTIEIVDQGIGIPLDEQARLFERFFRAKNAGNVAGTGLGLNIVKRQVDLMQGTISFQSEPEKGTTFIVELPQNLAQ